MICPHCNLAVKLDDDGLIEIYPYPDFEKTKFVYQVESATCPNCDDLIVIVRHGRGEKHKRGTGEYESLNLVEETNQEIIFPRSSSAPMPTEDMPEEIKGEYLEARLVVDASSRAAAALLRLCVQKLMPLLGEKGKNINDDIASLVQKGLPVEIQQALDSLRVIGNESVHPGEINLNDDRKTALLLFDLINFIVDRMITQPAKIKALYDKLPEEKLKGISTRDKKDRKGQTEL